MTGPVSAWSPRRRALSSAGAEQRAEHAARVGHPGGRQQVAGLDDWGDQVVGRARQGRVVQVPVLFGDEHRLADHLDHQRLGHRPQLVRGGHPERDAGQPVDVVGAPGEGHDRVQGQRNGAAAGGRLQDGQAVPSAGVRQQAAGQVRARRTEPGDQAGQDVVGHRHQDQVARAMTSSGGRTAASGSARPTRRSEASETADTATIRCPARCSATARAVPTLPAPTRRRPARRGGPEGQPQARRKRQARQGRGACGPGPGSWLFVISFQS